MTAEILEILNNNESQAVKLGMIRVLAIKKRHYRVKGLTKDIREYGIRYRAERMRKGLCTGCGEKNLTRPGKPCCQSCIDARKAR